MKYLDRYIKLRDEIWAEFEKLVRKGARFPTALDVTYPRGKNPDGLAVDSEGDSYICAIEVRADPQYQLHIGEGLIVGTSKVTFVDLEGNAHKIEPDILDTYWLCQCLDEARGLLDSPEASE